MKCNAKCKKNNYSFTNATILSGTLGCCRNVVISHAAVGIFINNSYNVVKV